jgi:hypothetical protein
MRRAAFKAERPVRSRKPVDDADGGHRTTPFGTNHRPSAIAHGAPGNQRVAQFGVDGNEPAAALLGCPIAKLDHGGHSAASIEHHVPGQIGDLAGAQPAFDGRQNNNTIALGVSGGIGEDEEIAYVVLRKKFGLFAGHNSQCVL